jgi:hypothetical protein
VLTSLFADAVKTSAESPRNTCPVASKRDKAGAMMYMTSGIEMNTIFGDGSSQSSSAGIVDKLLGAGKRLLTGESLL